MQSMQMVAFSRANADSASRASSRFATMAGSARRLVGVRLLAGALSFACTAAGAADPAISEFMAANATTLADDDGAFSDWVEIFNPNPTPFDLAGWYLTDTATNKKKWEFPAVNIPAGGYVVVYASSKNRRDAAKPLHTNFALSAGGEYLGLIRPDGVTVVSEFSPTYPAQRDDVSYGVTQAPDSGSAIGFFARPTPGHVNGVAVRHALTETVSFSRLSGPFSEPFSLQLSGASPGQSIRYVQAAPSKTGATLPAPTAASDGYTTPLTIAASVVIRAAVFAADGSASGPVTAAHFSELEAGLATFRSDLPVLVIDDHGLGALEKDGVDHPSWLYLYTPRAGAPTFATAPVVATPLTVSVRGQSAAEFPKKSYNLKFTDETGAKRAQTFFGSAAYEKWALVSPWYYDRTFIANSVAYALSNRIGRWAPRTEMVEVFFNTGARLGPAAYYGLAVLTDRIEVGNGRVPVTPLSGADVTAPAVSGGYIVKIDARDEDEFGFKTSRGIPFEPDAMVVVAYPKDADLALAQRTFIQDYIQTMEDRLYANYAGGWVARDYLDTIDRPTWVDHHLLNTFLANPDAFRRSAYFTKERNGRLSAGPIWDFDRAFNSADLRNTGPEGWRADFNGQDNQWEIGWWLPLSRDPEFMQEWVDRWQNLRRGELSDASLTALIDALARNVGAAAAARDAARWPDNVSEYGTYDQEIVEMKRWLVERGGWIDRQFLASPETSPLETTLRLTPAPGSQLAYTLDGSDPRSLGGGVAPTAIVTSQPVELPATANLHARSYAAARIGVFPGTPWSGCVSAAQSSPLTPVARIVNVSARNLVAAGDDALVARFEVADSTRKSMLARAIGPGLAAYGTTGLADPQLALAADGSTDVLVNRGWDANDNAAPLAKTFASVGAFPLTPGGGDAAVVATLESGRHTLKVTSASGGRGIALAELYELDANGRIPLFAFHGTLSADEGALTAGFVVRGPAYKRLLLCCRQSELTGPEASSLQLSLYRGSTLIATNAGWPTASNAAQIEAAAHALGFVISESANPALLVTLPPAAYTVMVQTNDGTPGRTTLEIHELP